MKDVKSVDSVSNATNTTRTRGNMRNRYARTNDIRIAIIVTLFAEYMYIY